MRKEEHTIASLEGYVKGHIDINALNLAVNACDFLDNTEEAISLFKASADAIELFGLRQDLRQIALEEAS